MKTWWISPPAEPSSTTTTIEHPTRGGGMRQTDMSDYLSTVETTAGQTGMPQYMNTDYCSQLGENDKSGSNGTTSPTLETTSTKEITQVSSTSMSDGARGIPSPGNIQNVVLQTPTQLMPSSGEGESTLMCKPNRKGWCMLHKIRMIRTQVTTKKWMDRGGGRGFGYKSLKTVKYQCSLQNTSDQMSTNRDTGERFREYSTSQHTIRVEGDNNLDVLEDSTGAGSDYNLLTEDERESGR